jgi:hypothetical protein
MSKLIAILIAGLGIVLVTLAIPACATPTCRCECVNPAGTQGIVFEESPRQGFELWPPIVMQHDPFSNCLEVNDDGALVLIECPTFKPGLYCNGKPCDWDVQDIILE